MQILFGTNVDPLEFPTLLILTLLSAATIDLIIIDSKRAPQVISTFGASKLGDEEYSADGTVVTLQVEVRSSQAPALSTALADATQGRVQLTPP